MISLNDFTENEEHTVTMENVYILCILCIYFHAELLFCEQIVAGVNYRIIAEIGFTNCRKNAIQVPDSCQTQQVYEFT